MAPVPTVVPEHPSIGVLTPPVPYQPPLDLIVALSREIVVDWQLPTDVDRTGH
ncbi:MAG TPA: hypothetical protein VL337_13330 [Acidimicrobiales bacterium]|jgi:hypothetical protein|nr:hypothetical protein [Acidimicrobiales bacterium]